MLIKGSLLLAIASNSFSDEKSIDQNLMLKEKKKANFCYGMAQTYYYKPNL